MVNGFNLTVGGPNKHQFESKPVLTSNNAFFVFVIIGRCAQLPENHLGNPHIILGVLSHIDTISVVLHDNVPGNRVNGNVNIRNEFLV